MQRVSGTRSWPKGMRGTSAVACTAARMGGPLRARVYRSRLCILMGRPSVARPALFAAVPLRAPYDCKKTPGRVCGHGEITCMCRAFLRLCVHGQRPLQARVLIEILGILMGERYVARPELRALFDIALQALFGTE